MLHAAFATYILNKHDHKHEWAVSYIKLKK